MRSNVEVTVDESSLSLFERALARDFASKYVTPVEEAMAERFFEIVRLNFGNSGVDRPSSWAPLSPAYARRVGRDHATLFVSGTLAAAVQHWGPRVFLDNALVPYAMAQMKGRPDANLPARSAFPMDDQGQVLPWTREKVTDVAREELARILVNR